MVCVELVSPGRDIELKSEVHVGVHQPYFVTGRERPLFMEGRGLGDLWGALNFEKYNLGSPIFFQKIEGSRNLFPV